MEERLGTELNKYKKPQPSPLQLTFGSCSVPLPIITAMKR